MGLLGADEGTARRRREARRVGPCHRRVLLPAMAIVPAPQAAAVDYHPWPPSLARERRHVSRCKFFQILYRNRAAA